MAPTWILLLEPRNTKIVFSIQSTPQNTKKFTKRLGLELNVYKTTLGDIEHVYISRYIPNQTSFTTIPGFATKNNGSSGLPNLGVKTLITADVDASTGKIASLTGHLDIRSDDLKSALSSGYQVKPIFLSACNFAMSVGEAVRLKLDFPVPVAESRCKTRIARKSSYVEFISPVDIDAWKDSLALAYPVFLNGCTPAVWNMPYLNLHNLPILDTSQQEKIQWLVTHASSMLSACERTLCEDPSALSLEVECVRLNFKDLLFSIFMHLTGLQTARQEHVFGINNPTGGSVYIVLFVSNLRLDLANRTVILDTAVLPLYDGLIPKIREFLAALTNRGIYHIKVNDMELHL